LKPGANVSASGGANFGRSVVAETLQNLTNQADLCRNTIDLLEAGQQVSRGEALAGLSRLFDACQNLRDAILSEDSAADWGSVDELHELVIRLDDAASKRRRYLDLAQVLAGGTVIHRRERSRQERLALRDAAVAELMEISDLAAPPELPGPSADEWLPWACSLEDGVDDPDLIHLKNHFPNLDDFVSEMEIEWWQEGNARPAVQLGASIPAISVTSPAPPVAQPSASSSSGSGADPASAQAFSHSDSDIAIEEETEAPDTAAVNELQHEHADETEASIDPDVAELLKSATLEPVATPAPQLSVESGDHVVTLTDTLLSGKLSFFAWNDVDQFARHLEKAKVNPHEDRQVRALLAISHWLEPREHNPVLHPTCGIRALTGYTGTSAAAVSDPEDVAKAIEDDERLALFSGGAALLRWGLLQPSEEQFNGIAPIRRLRFDQIKAWFGEVYQIELAEQQFRDIYTLTSGIPILIGELHKLIITNADEPPSWIGHAPWVEIKSKYELLIPKVAQELKRGLRSVRLTEREIALIKMVVIASEDSTADTISSNLSDNWVKYGRSEFRPMSSRDEVCVALLQDLGLLPMRRVGGQQDRTKTLLPLESGDALRLISNHI
jgi:hypothetical protein